MIDARSPPPSPPSPHLAFAEISAHPRAKHSICLASDLWLLESLSRAFKVPPHPPHTPSIPPPPSQALSELILRARGEKRKEKTNTTAILNPRSLKSALSVFALALIVSNATSRLQPPPLGATVVPACELTDLWAFCSHHHLLFSRTSWER